MSLVSEHTVLRESKNSGIPKVLFYRFWYNNIIKGKREKENNLMVRNQLVFSGVYTVLCLHHFSYPRPLLALFPASCFRPGEHTRALVAGAFPQKITENAAKDLILLFESSFEGTGFSALWAIKYLEERGFLDKARKTALGGNAYRLVQRAAINARKTLAWKSMNTIGESRGKSYWAINVLRNHADQGVQASCTGAATCKYRER